MRGHGMSCCLLTRRFDMSGHVKVRYNSLHCLLGGVMETVLLELYDSQYVNYFNTVEVGML